MLQCHLFIVSDALFCALTLFDHEVALTLTFIHLHSIEATVLHFFLGFYLPLCADEPSLFLHEFTLTLESTSS